ncbi:MAG: hypothetical protein ACYCXP_09600 [Leptospirillum sp.]
MAYHYAQFRESNDNTADNHEDGSKKQLPLFPTQRKMILDTLNIRKTLIHPDQDALSIFFLAQK